MRRHVELANEALRTAGLAERVSFAVGSAERLPVGDGWFDLV
jgi:ubiquinone/menaquinone biosynthesis C-methylase UbiE